MSLQKWLLDRRVNKEQGDIQTLESYKGYNVGDSIYFSDADKKMKTGVFIKVEQKDDSAPTVIFTNSKGKEDSTLGYFLISKDDYEKQLKKEKEKEKQKEANKIVAAKKRKATMLAKKAQKAEDSQIAILSGDVKIPDRITMVFLNKLSRPFSIEKTDSKSYYVAWNTDTKEETSFYFTKTLKLMAEEIVGLGMESFLETYTY